MFSKLGNKIIKDMNKPKRAPVQKSIVSGEDDDAFQRYHGGDNDDVYYHGGGHHHDHDDGLDDDAKYAKAMFQLKCVLIVGLVFVSA